MSSAMNMTSLPAVTAAAVSVSPNLVSNSNSGSGAQKNSQQTGGCNNTQFNADTINYHAVQERARTPPPPTSTVPFHRDPDFVGRPQLEELDEKLSVCNKRVALLGLGGVGKSQLAIEFCYRIRDRSPEVWTFWVHASSAVRFDADIRKLACDAAIPGCDNPESDAFALVYNWLHEKRNGKWVLVLDNVDDPDFLFRAPDVNEGSSSNKSVLRNRIAYLPPCEHGSILITSRTREATARLADECNVITVEPMEEATAVVLLEKKLGKSEVTEDVRKLAAALDHMPLALAQAGAYIKQRGSRCSVRQYLAKLEKSERSQTSLLASALKELRRDEEAQNSIILTWQISFDHILAKRPSAADLLSLMSMYNYQGIPESLVKAEVRDTRAGARVESSLSGVEQDSDASSSSSRSDDEDSDADDFEDDILMLENFHFISTTFSSTAFQMHRLVQLAARVWLRSRDLFQEWARKGIERLDETLPNGNHENWERCLELYPHVTSTLQLYEKEQSLSRASIQYKAAWFDWRRGLWSNAEALIMKSYKIRTKALGLEDHKTLQARHILALVLSDEGKYEAAEEANRQVLEVREKVLGKEHPETLASRNNLADVLCRQGKYEAAEEANRQVLEVREKVLGREHLATLTSRSNLAVVLSCQGKYEAAEEANRQVLEVSEKVLGKEHPETLVSVWCLADLMERLERKRDALSLYERAVTGLTTSLGARHPDTLRCQGSLSRLQRQN